MRPLSGNMRNANNRPTGAVQLAKVEWGRYRPVTDTNADGGIQSPVNVFGMAKFLLPHYKTGVIQSGADCLWIIEFRSPSIRLIDPRLVGPDFHDEETMKRDCTDCRRFSGRLVVLSTMAVMPSISFAYSCWHPSPQQLLEAPRVIFLGTVTRLVKATLPIHLF